MTATFLPPMTIAPAQVLRGDGILAQAGAAIAHLGRQPMIVGGDKALTVVQPFWGKALVGLDVAEVACRPDCCESTLAQLEHGAAQHQADVIVGVGGGKALDAAKLLAHRLQLPIVTIPTSAATCAAWTALSNIYSEAGAFRYDVGLDRCPDLLILDYGLIRTAPQRTLIAGIGDALAKWYEASVSSGHIHQTLIVAAVQQARVLRDLLFQKSISALKSAHSPEWQDVVDANVLMAGVIGGMGGAQCRTVAAHAVHNGLTQLSASHDILHGEKVAYGILVQLRLEELSQGNQLAATARYQLLKFYRHIGLPTSLSDLGLHQIAIADLQQAAEFACAESSDIHHLPFPVEPIQLMAAMVSTTAPPAARASSNAEVTVAIGEPAQEVGA